MAKRVATETRDAATLLTRLSLDDAARATDLLERPIFQASERVSLVIDLEVSTRATRVAVLVAILVRDRPDGLPEDLGGELEDSRQRAALLTWPVPGCAIMSVIDDHLWASPMAEGLMPLAIDDWGLPRGKLDLSHEEIRGVDRRPKGFFRL